jgi:hypothetical protein
MESLEPRQMLTIVPIEGTPFWDHPGNYIPPQETRMATEGYLSGAATGDPLSIGINYLRQNAADYGLTTVDLSAGHYYVTRQYTEAASGITHIYLQQRFNDLPVEGAGASVHVDRSGRVIAAAANFARSVPYPVVISAPSTDIGAEEAVSAYAAGAGLSYDGMLDVISNPVGHSQRSAFADSDLSPDPIPAELHYVPTPHGLQLAWRITARTPDNRHWFDVSVGATGSQAGQVVRASDWVKDASYNVFPVPVQDPADGNPAVVFDPQDPVASPFGWHDTNGIAGPEFLDTRGNNVDVSHSGMPPRPNGGPTLDFLSPIGLPPPQPATYLDFSATQLFYGINLAHDVLFHYGFDEAAGNFQFRNYSGQGLGFDPVIALAQQGAVQNNAFWVPTPDGIQPMLVMGVSTVFNPQRDITLDNVVIFHEYFHGVSTRLAGGPDDFNSLSACQSGGMGEGWSDWFGVLMTLKPTDNKNTPQTVGEWAFGPGGIRRFPYSFNKNINPLTLRFYNDNSSLIPGIPSTLFPCLTVGTEVHNSGEIWAQTLLDMTWLLIEKYGFSNNLYTGTGGQNVALDLVLQGLKLSPANPTFIEARDAIIAADFALYGGANFNEIWEAFARRGLGKSANVGADSPTLGNAANSFIVAEAFDRPPGPAFISGAVFNDVNGDGNRNNGDPGVASWTVYVDANDNGQLDSNERRTQTDANGNYSLLIFGSGSQQIVLREVLQSGWKQTLPANNGARRFTIQRGQGVTNQSFGIQQNGGEIRGLKWNDLNADGLRDPNEPGLEGVTIFVDLNNDGLIGIMEPAAVTDRFGNYRILNVRPGNFYTVREVPQPGQTQTFPDKAAGGAHFNVIVNSGQITPNINFGNVALFDFGDAPAGYDTKLPNGARHGVLAGFHLGTTIDSEQDGQPTSDATGDGLDEDGVLLTTGLTPGTQASMLVLVNTGGASPGRLQGWVDWNQNFKFDPGERVISNRTLGTGTHTITFNVPANAPLGATFARFRYGYEPDLGPSGLSIAGEVEDYAVTVLSNAPLANPDVFPRPGDPLIKQGTVDNVLDVLANDFGTTFGPPQIVPFSFPDTTPDGSRLRLNITGDRILFTPGPNTIGPVTFEYQVTDGRTLSNRARVTVNVSVSDPKAVDDTVIVPFTTPPGFPPQVNIPVMQNDVVPFASTRIVAGSVQKIGRGLSIPGDSIAIASDGTSLNFVPPQGFRGTIMYQYTIDDNDPVTNPATARLTVQVVDVVAGNPQSVPPDQTFGHQAQLVVEFFDPNTGDPISQVREGDTFLLRVSSQDLRLGGDDTNRGVETAYSDLVWSLLANPQSFVPVQGLSPGRNFIEPVTNEANPFGFDIIFDPEYSFAQRGQANTPAPGGINEVGGSHDASANDGTPGPVGQGLKTVFTIFMRAKAATPAGQPLRVFVDPADPSPSGNDFSQIFLANQNPSIPAPTPTVDEDIFLRPSGTLTILPLASAEGEFTNPINPLDVNLDGTVSAIDSLVVVNELNLRGARPLSISEFVVHGRAAPQYRIDTNIDSHLSAIDLLMVFNYLNGPAATSANLGGEAEAAASLPMAEGEGSSAANDAPTSALAFALASEEQDSTSALAPSEGSSRQFNERTSSAAALANALASSAQPVTSPVRPENDSLAGDKEMSADAADELFALLCGEE